MANVKVKGRVVRRDESPYGGTVLHVAPSDPLALRQIDGSYRAGVDAVAVHVSGDPEGVAEIGELVDLSASEANPGSAGAYLRTREAGAVSENDEGGRRRRTGGGGSSGATDEGGGGAPA